MKSTISYLDDAKAKLGIESDYGMAKWMGVTRNAISCYRLGKTVMDDYAAAKIAEVLDIAEIEVIYAANAERERNQERREFWQKKLAELGGIAASIFLIVTFIVTPTPAQASNEAAFTNDRLYIMLNHRKGKCAAYIATLSFAHHERFLVLCYFK